MTVRTALNRIFHSKNKSDYTFLDKEKYAASKLFSLGNTDVAIKFPYLRESFTKQGKSVSQVLAETLPNTFVLAIAAITVVLPIGFLISSIGMAIGIGGSSVISLALGADKVEKAKKVFGNQISLTTLSSLILVTLCFAFEEHVLRLFGANGNILEPALPYFRVIIIGGTCSCCVRQARSCKMPL